MIPLQIQTYYLSYNNFVCMCCCCFISPRGGLQASICGSVYYYYYYLFLFLWAYKRNLSNRRLTLPTMSKALGARIKKIFKNSRIWSREYWWSWSYTDCNFLDISDSESTTFFPWKIFLFACSLTKGIGNHDFIVQDEQCVSL